MNHLNIISKQADGKTVFAIEGELSIYTVKEAREKFLEVYDKSDNIEIDLDNVLKMDSAGFQLLLSIKLEQVFQSKKISFVNPSREVTKVFELYRETLH